MHIIVLVIADQKEF